jgi:hypothetical protein
MWESDYRFVPVQQLWQKILLSWLTQIKTQKRGEYFMTEDFTQLADSDKNTEERQVLLNIKYTICMSWELCS